MMVKIFQPVIPVRSAPAVPMGALANLAALIGFVEFQILHITVPSFQLKVNVVLIMNALVIMNLKLTKMILGTMIKILGNLPASNHLPLDENDVFGC